MKKNINITKIKYLKIIVAIILLVAIDQIIKINMIDKEFGIFKYVENYGIAFSFWKNNLSQIILSIIMIIIFVIVLLKNISNTRYIISTILIISGSISNLIDRATKGFVIDYINIDLQIFDNYLNFPVFNLADICIVVGIFILIVVIINDIIKM